LLPIGPHCILRNARLESPILKGRHVRLEPLAHAHADGLAAASAGDPSLYQWSAVPIGRGAVLRYIETALALRDAGAAVPFATVRIADGTVIGSTRFFDIERFAWPAEHPRHGRELPDVCEIGYTWLTHSAIRTGANTEAKLLMLTHAFEVWKMLRICLHTDARNKRSQAAIERIGGKFEGALRAHCMGADFTARESFRYSILATECPDAKRRITERLMPA
jgi:RimJ/RimL family protein N-acetyltransferase